MDRAVPGSEISGLTKLSNTMARNFIIYNTTTGEIFKTLSVSPLPDGTMTEEDFFAQMVLPAIPSGHTILEYSDPNTEVLGHYVDTTNLTLVKFPDRPADGYYNYNPTTKQWDVDVPATTQKVIEQRNQLLADTDWYIIRSADTGQAVPAGVREYRQALRNLEQQAGFPTAITWPTL